MIIYCHLLNDSSGSPTVLRTTISQLDAMHISSRLFVGSQGQGVLSQVGIQTQTYWYRRSKFKVVTLLSLILSQILLFCSLVRSKDIPADAVVFSNTLLPFGAMVWGKLTGRPVVVHIHEATLSPAPLRWLLITIPRLCADLLIYVSKDHMRRLPIRGVESRVIANPISFYDKRRQHNTSDRKSAEFVVLMLASLRGFKGIEEFVVLAEHMLNVKDLKFTLVLNETERDVDGFRTARALPDNMVVYSRTNEPARFYERASLVVNLSRVDKVVETFGLTLVEAMSFGIPVIGPPIGGPVEIIRDGVDGYLIDSRDTESLKKAVLTLLQHRDIYRGMCHEARSRATDFAPETYAEHMVNALKRFNI